MPDKETQYPLDCNRSNNSSAMQQSPPPNKPQQRQPQQPWVDMLPPMGPAKRVSMDHVTEGFLTQDTSQETTSMMDHYYDMLDNDWPSVDEHGHVAHETSSPICSSMLLMEHLEQDLFLATEHEEHHRHEDKNDDVCMEDDDDDDDDESARQRYADLLQERRTKLAASMEKSAASRTILEQHIQQRANLANVLQDIERSSQQVVQLIHEEDASDEHSSTETEQEDDGMFERNVMKSVQV